MMTTLSSLGLTMPTGTARKRRKFELRWWATPAKVAVILTEVKSKNAGARRPRVSTALWAGFASFIAVVFLILTLGERRGAVSAEFVGFTNLLGRRCAVVLVTNSHHYAVRFSQILEEKVPAGWNSVNSFQNPHPPLQFNLANAIFRGWKDLPGPVIACEETSAQADLLQSGQGRKLFVKMSYIDGAWRMRVFSYPANPSLLYRVRLQAANKLGRSPWFKLQKWVRPQLPLETTNTAEREDRFVPDQM